MRSRTASTPSTTLAIVLACGAPLAAHAQTAAVQTSAAASSKDLPRAPAFRARELTTPLRSGWITNGGMLSNRWSPLAQIDRSNVASLRAVWRASLGGSGMKPNSANQAQPIVYDGVIYVVTGATTTLSRSRSTPARCSGTIAQRASRSSFAR